MKSHSSAAHAYMQRQQETQFQRSEKGQECVEYNKFSGKHIHL